MNVQLIGMASTLVILGQLWLAQVMPTRAFAGALAMSVAVGAAGAARARGRLEARKWLPFEALVSLLGVVAVPQVWGFGTTLVAAAAQSCRSKCTTASAQLGQRVHNWSVHLLVPEPDSLATHTHNCTHNTPAQVLIATFTSAAAPSLAPSLAAVAAAALWLRGPAAASVGDFQKAVGLLPGWCATAMFALMPLPQLVSSNAWVLHRRFAMLARFA